MLISGQQDKNQPRIHIIGAGALGVNLYQQLLPIAEPVLVGRSPGQRSVNGQSIPVMSWLQLSSIDTAIICCKVYHLAEVVEQLEPHLSTTSHVISLCNGMGYDALFTSLPGHFSPGVTTAASTRHGDDVTIISKGDTTLGSQIQPPEWIGKSTWQWQPDMRKARWSKLMVSAVINPLSVLCDVRNGALLRGTAYHYLRSLSGELNDLAQALALDLPDVPRMVISVCESTAGNFSSSNQDVNAGRPTELRWICGYILQQAAQHKVAMPAYFEMCEELRDLGHVTKLV